MLAIESERRYNMGMIKLSEHIDDKRKCLLCPNFCILSEGQSGRCKVRKYDSEIGDIVLNYYGLVSAMAVEPIEKKPITYFLPGTKTLSVGGFGCSFNCAFCLPPYALISTPKGQVRIDQIEDGEEIFALDNSSSDPQLVLAHVGHVSDREAEEVIVIEVDGGRLELTLEHPVMTKNRGWVEAGDLTCDDEVLCDKTCL